MSCNGKSSPQHHGIAVARAGMRRCRREIGPAIAARGQNGLVRPEAVNGAVLHRQRHDAPAHAIFHDQIKREILDEEFRLVAQRLAVERVQHGVPRAVGSGTGALGRRPLAKILHHAAERALVNLALFGARKRHAEMFEFIDRRGCMAAEIFNGILVAQPVRALHRVIHVPAPVISAHVAKRSRNAALRCHRMRARGKHFRDAGRFQSGLRSPKRGAKPRAAGAYDNHIKAMLGYGIGIFRCHQLPKLIFNNRIKCRHADNYSKNRVCQKTPMKQARILHIILKHHLHAKPHVPENGSK